MNSIFGIPVLGKLDSETGKVTYTSQPVHDERGRVIAVHKFCAHCGRRGSLVRHFLKGKLVKLHVGCIAAAERAL